jgi:hypothetical protein
MTIKLYKSNLNTYKIQNTKQYNIYYSHIRVTYIGISYTTIDSVYYKTNATTHIVSLKIVVKTKINI